MTEELSYFQLVVVQLTALQYNDVDACQREQKCCPFLRWLVEPHVAELRRWVLSTYSSVREVANCKHRIAELFGNTRWTTFLKMRESYVETVVTEVR